MGAEEDHRDQPRPSPILRKARYSRSLERGLAILACFTPERPVLGIAELAERLGTTRSTTHRYVSTLVSLGYLEQDASRKYRLALGAIDLGAALNATGLCKHARPELEQLSQRSGYSAEIAVLDGLGDPARRPGAGKARRAKKSVESVPPRAATRLLHEHGQGAPGLPSEGAAREADRGNGAAEAWTAHDHDQDGITRPARGRTAGRLRDRRRRAARGLARHRGTRARRVREM